MKILIKRFTSLSTGWEKDTKVLRVEHRPTYDIRVEKVTFGDSKPLIMRSCYNKQGYYIGDEKFAQYLETKGIVPEAISPDHKVCSIGWSELEGKWFGWSHRAMWGFKVGDTVKEGDCAYCPKDKNSWIRSVILWNNDTIDPVIGYSWDDSLLELTIKKSRGSVIVERFEPQQTGKGEWTASTLRDCRRMAIDFAESVSSSVPEWWAEPSENRYCPGMTKGEEIMDFLDRHRVSMENGKYVFWHATSKDNMIRIKESGLQAGSYLAFSKQAAAKLARINKKVSGLVVLKVLTHPWQIVPGTHPTLRNEYLIGGV